ncbi:MAG TPA: DUF5681 domain-containing protein [Bacteroidales bacterium]|nr:DUF5681 domain-containing protein [Bacteroidales bacterium]HQH23589.1 DUF5681 domain-containing protein [Bacteroidales bacterium]HQJ81111.1 DUF5681 domain-containing protein [Bacteroidales bacterium]
MVHSRFKPGQSGNPKGRPKGVKNKVTTETRAWLQKIVNDNRQQLEVDLMRLDPRDRWNIIEKLLQYCLPKLSTIDASVQFEQLNEETIEQIVNELLQSIRK